MAKKKFAIMGATGQIGFALTEELIKKGHRVHAIGRDKKKLQKLKERGAEAFSAEFDDVNDLSRIFKGSNAVFTMIPPAYTEENYEGFQNLVGEAIKSALHLAEVDHVVNLSSLGAQLPEGTGPIKGLYLQEQRLNSVPELNVLHFRPGYFMENLMASIPSIRSSGVIGSCLKVDLPIPMVTTRDIGLKVAEIMDLLAFTDKSIFEFVGPSEITMKDVTTVLGRAIGEPNLKYEELTPEQLEKNMTELGMKPQLIKLLIEMELAMNDKKIVPTEEMTAEHKGRITIEEFGTIFSQVYHAAVHLAKQNGGV